MSIGGKGSAETHQQTDTTVTNQQVGASEGALAFGAQSSGNVINDASIISRTGDALAKIADQSITAGVLSSRDSLDFAGHSLDVVSRTTQAANDLLSRSYETYAAKIADNAGVAPQTLTQESIKYVTWAAAGVAAIYFITQFRAKKVA